MEEQNLKKETTVTVNRKEGLFLPIAILIAAVLVSGSILYTKGNSQNGAPSAPKIAVDIKDVKTEGDPFIGDANAPVVLAYWFDYQCPFCKKFDLDEMPDLVEKYVKEGKLKIVFKNFQFLGNDSQDGALVAKAVWKLYPAAYEKWRIAMMNAQDDEGDMGFGKMETIITLIEKDVPEIDVNAILLDINQNRSVYQSAIDTEKAEAAAMGITGTPGFIIGTQSLSGAQPLAVFSGLIDAQLNKKQ